MDASFVHFCMNETVNGFEMNNFPFHIFPQDMRVVCDMTSNFATQPVDWSKYDVVYVAA